MVFSSLLFLFIYLPVVLVIYYITPLKWRNFMLLIANLIFYAWGEPVYILIMVASIFVDYTHGLLVEKYRNNDKKARKVVASSVLFNLGILLFFKYYDFIILNITSTIPSFSGVLHPLGVSLPIGISFYTFQTMSYTIDVYRKQAPVQRNLTAFGVYVTLFPQLIAGPIVRYKDVSEQLIKREISWRKFADGVKIFTVGLSKKVLLANNIGILWEICNQNTTSLLAAWLGVLAFYFQIYFDFSGYSDMARGLGRMLGFEFLENFNYPFISKSATEFWRRWHISLGTWFREYVYIPLGGNKRGKIRTYSNIFVVWILTGIWHGASWNFMFWGLYFAVILVIEKLFLNKLLEKLPCFVSRIYFFVIIGVSWVVFAIDSGMKDVFTYLSVMFGGTQNVFTAEALYNLVNYLPLLMICTVAATPLFKVLFSKIEDQKRIVLEVGFVILGLFLSTAYLVDSSYNPFLYFRF